MKIEKTNPELAQELALQTIKYGITGECDNELLKDYIIRDSKSVGRPKTVDAERIREMRAEGATLTAISKALNCSLSSVKRALAANDTLTTKQETKEVKYRYRDPETNEYYDESLILAWGWDGYSDQLPFGIIKEEI